MAVAKSTSAISGVTLRMSSGTDTNNVLVRKLGSVITVESILSFGYCCFFSCAFDGGLTLLLTVILAIVEALDEAFSYFCSV